MIYTISGKLNQDGRVFTSVWTARTDEQGAIEFAQAKLAAIGEIVSVAVYTGAEGVGEGLGHCVGRFFRRPAR